MLECDLCPKRVKNAQGLRGHYRFAHAVERGPGEPSRAVERSSFVTENRLDEVLNEQFGGGLPDRLVQQAAERFRPILEEQIRELAEPLSEAMASLRERVGKLEGVAVLESHKPGLCREPHCHPCNDERNGIATGVLNNIETAMAWAGKFDARQEVREATAGWIDAGKPEVPADENEPDPPAPDFFITG